MRITLFAFETNANHTLIQNERVTYCVSITEISESNRMVVSLYILTLTTWHKFTISDGENTERGEMVCNF
jgi:hypothetical protein